MYGIQKITMGERQETVRIIPLFPSKKHDGSWRTNDAPRSKLRGIVSRKEFIRKPLSPPQATGYASRRNQFFFIVIVLILLGGLVGCDDEPISTITPPIAPPRATQTVPLPTVVISEISPTTIDDGQQATDDAQPTATREIPTATPEIPTPQPSPTPTPIPSAQPLSGVSLQWVAGGFEKPVFLTHAGNQRLFVVEQVGKIQLIDEAGNRLSTPFLDIVGRVNSGASEQGLLSVAFHPQYAGNGRFFVNYTNRNGSTVVSEFQVSEDGNVADAGSERILLIVPQPYENHNGGQIQFGLDGYLYIGMGDGGSAGDPHGHGQDAGTLLGSLLRIDVDFSEPYAIPSDNPFLNDDSARVEAWAIGLRNPWRFSFDRLTGDLFVADVGQNSFEEISWMPAGAASGGNFGWKVMEGFNCYENAGCDPSPFIPPIHHYGRDEGCSVTGGYIYRGSQSPALFGHYLFSDYCLGQIWSLAQFNGVWTRTLLLDTNYNVSSFGEDANGELYLLNYAGEVYKIVAE